MRMLLKMKVQRTRAGPGQTSTGRSQIRKKQWRIQGEGPGGPDPPLRPDACLRLKFLYGKDGISLFNSINQSSNLLFAP